MEFQARKGSLDRSSMDRNRNKTHCNSLALSVYSALGIVLSSVFVDDLVKLYRGVYLFTTLTLLKSMDSELFALTFNFVHITLAANNFIYILFYFSLYLKSFT